MRNLNHGFRRINGRLVIFWKSPRMIEPSKCSLTVRFQLLRYFCYQAEIFIQLALWTTPAKRHPFSSVTIWRFTPFARFESRLKLASDFRLKPLFAALPSRDVRGFCPIVRLIGRDDKSCAQWIPAENHAANCATDTWFLSITTPHWQVRVFPFTIAHIDEQGLDNFPLFICQVCFVFFSHNKIIVLISFYEHTL